MLFRASFGKNSRRNAQRRTIVATGAIHTQKQTVFASPTFRKIQQGPDPIPAQAGKKIDSPIRTCAPSQKTKLTLNFMKRKMKEYEELKKEINKN